MKPLFETLAEATLDECRFTYQERGEQYGDTFKKCQWLVLKSVFLELFNLTLTEKQCIAIYLSGLCDQKYQRFDGGWRDDHPIDSINYQAALSSVMRELQRIKDAETSKLCYPAPMKSDDLDNIREV